MHPTDKAARVAGAAYLSIVVVAPFSLIYVPRTLIVAGDATETAKNIVKHEMLFRSAVAGEMISVIIFIFLVMTLYRLLSGVNKGQALHMVALALVSAAIGFMNTLGNLAALTVFRGADFLLAIGEPQRHALGMLSLRLNSHGIVINEMF